MAPKGGDIINPLASQRGEGKATAEHSAKAQSPSPRELAARWPRNLEALVVELVDTLS